MVRLFSKKTAVLFFLLALLSGMLPAVSFAAVQPFFAPAETSGSVSVKLYPMENVSSGQTKLVTFGVPFPRGSITPADVSKIRVLKGGVEIPAYVEMLTPWRHMTTPALDGTSVRIARIQIQYTFTSVYPNYETITVQWGVTNRTQNIPAFTNPRTAWHKVTSGSFVASDNVYEPDVYAVLPKEFLAKGVLKGTRMNPFDGSVTETRSDPATMDATEHWPGFTEAEHAFKNNFYSVINEDDPAVIPGPSGSGYLSDYKTNYDPWLYDRSSTMFTLYMRNGSLKALREAVRSTDYYKSQIYPGGTTPARAVGLFKLKNPDPNGWPGGNGAMYSYNECLAYTHWLTGDNDVLPYVPWIVSAHEMNDEPTRWSPSLTVWTERHTSFRLLANLIAYEVTGDNTYKTNVLTQTGDFIWHQNGAGGALPGNRVDGGLYHYGSQHGDGVAGDLVASSWMSALTADAMVRAYAFTEDANIANFVKRLGNFLNTASKADPYHMYDTYSGSLRYPDYMMKYDGTTDAVSGERGSPSNPYGGTTIEHNLDVAAAMLWAEYFNQFTGGSANPTWKATIEDLYEGYDIGVNYWIRPTGPSVGKTAFRVTPYRKWGWEHRISGSFSWLASQILTGSPPSDTTPPTVSVTAPTAGSTVSGTIALSANAADNVGVAGVQFRVDGVNVGSEDTSPPYSISYDTTALSNGPHTITAVARDTSDNTTVSSGVTVTVSNESPGGGTVTYRQGENGYAGAKDVSISSQYGGNGTRIIDGTLKVFDQTGQATPYEINSLLRFDNLSIPTGKTVTSAKLTLRLNTWASGFTMQGRYMKTDYDPTYAQIGWLDRKPGAQWAAPGAKGNGTDYIAGKSFEITGFTASGNQTREVNLDPAVVQGWIDNPSSNHGVLLFIDHPTNIAVDIYSAEDATIGNRPMLTITYQ